MKAITNLLKVINIKELIDSPQHKALVKFLKSKARLHTNVLIKQLRTLNLIAPTNQQYLKTIINHIKEANFTKIYIHSYFIKRVVTPVGTAYLIMIRFKFFKSSTDYFTFTPFPKDIFPCIKFRITEVINVLANKCYKDQNSGNVPYKNRDFDEIELEELTDRMVNAYATDKRHSRDGLKHNLITEAFYKYVHAGSVFKRYLSNYSTQELIHS